MKRTQGRPAASGKARIISLLLACLLAAPSLQAQSGDWQVVRNLEIGREMIVKTDRRFYCSMEGATNDQLVCEARKRWFGHLTLTFSRAEIREVRTLPSQKKHMWVGAGIGAGAGAIAGASGHDTSRGAYAMFGALGGALFGSVVGGIVGLFKLRGKVIYRAVDKDADGGKGRRAPAGQELGKPGEEQVQKPPA